MKKFRKALLIILGTTAILHAGVWIMDQNLIKDLREQGQQNREKKLVRIGELRRKLEARQKKEIESYGWSEKDKGVARIPVSRAYSYYLRSLPRE